MQSMPSLAHLSSAAEQVGLLCRHGAHLMPLRYDSLLVLNVVGIIIIIIIIINVQAWRQ